MSFNSCTTPGDDNKPSKPLICIGATTGASVMLNPSLYGYIPLYTSSDAGLYIVQDVMLDIITTIINKIMKKFKENIDYIISYG
jgi:hypothetical protein